MPLHRLIHQLGLYCFSVALVTSRGYVPRDRTLLRAFCRWNVHNGKQHATVTFVLMKGTANYCCGVVPLPTPSYMTLIPNPLHLTSSGRPHCTSPCNVPIIIWSCKDIDNYTVLSYSKLFISALIWISGGLKRILIYHSRMGNHSS